MRRRVAASGVVFVIALALGACAGPVEVVSANPQVITIRHTPDARYQSDSEAQRYCGQYNKTAHWRTSTAEPTNQELTIYDCMPM
ncbi:MAG TPA: hypothetical protein VMH36_08785 [Alphaproteobacteria bacterium]|nr:hypothetical protein [Alphaproteobacteria bacterium]